MATALAARALGAERRVQVAEMIASADRIVAVCQWLYDALAANGVPPEKLVLSRQGLPAAFLTASEGARAAKRSCSGERPLKLLYIGRWHPVKGVDTVVRAVQALPSDTRVLLTIHGLPGEPAYERRVRKIAGGDRRIVFAPPLGRSDVAAEMVRHDALVVPSVWLETGPLVVLEAQAAGLYVMGSRLGGIAELVSEGADGELVDAGSVRAWTEAITRLAERHAKGALGCQPSEVRTMSTVAAEMAELYGSL